MSDFAIADDIAAVWRPLTTEEGVIVDAIITQASNLLRGLVPTVDAMIVDNPLKASLAKAAVVNAVVRRFTNPDGVLEFSIDDYTERRDSTISTGKLYIDGNDIVGLRRRRASFGTIRLGTSF